MPSIWARCCTSLAPALTNAERLRVAPNGGFCHNCALAGGPTRTPAGLCGALSAFSVPLQTSTETRDFRTHPGNPLSGRLRYGQEPG